MFFRKRKLRKRISLPVKRKRIFFPLVGIVVLIFISGGVSALFFNLHKQAYISPLVKACQHAKFCMPSEDADHHSIVEQLLAAKQIPFKHVSFANDTYTISFQDGAEVFLSAKKDLNSQISSLQYIVSRLTMEGRQFKQLDLSFDKPVIAF